MAVTNCPLEISNFSMLWVALTIGSLDFLIS